MPSALVTLQLQSQVAPQIAQTADAYKALSAAEQKAEQDATRYAQALQKVALADAKTATEEQRLAVQTANAARAQTQAEAAALRLAQAQNKVAGGNSFAAQTADALKSQLLGLVGPAALASAGIAAIKGSIDLAVEGENIGRIERSFESLAKQAGTTGDTILAALRKASGGEISDLNLELATNKGLLLGVANTAQDFAAIMEIARDRAAKMGITTTQAYDDITTGIGRESPRILDNLGIIVDADLANKQYADSIGKATDQLSKAERIEALRTAVIAQGKATLDAATTATNNQNNSFARMGVLAENAKNKLAIAAKTGFEPYVRSVVDASDATGSFINWLQSLGTVAPGADAALAAFDAEMARSGDSAKAEIAYQSALAAARVKAIPPVQQTTAAIIAGGGAFNAYAAAVGGAGSEALTTATKIQFAAQAMDISARASVADSAAKDAQTAKTALLSAQSAAAVSSFLALNPQIDASGVAALVAAGKIDAEIGRLAALRVEAQGAKDELIKLNNANAQSKLDQLVTLRSGQGIASGRGGGSDAAAEGQAFADALGRQATQAKKLLDDQIAYAKATGDTAKARRLLNQELADAKKSGDLGEQAHIIDAIASLDKKGNTGRISAAESTALRLSDIARTSGDDRARIERENQEKLRDAQADFDVRSTRSEEDYQEKRRGLLARGQRAQAAALAADHAKDARRAQEDFNRERQRTVRNNREALGDQGTRVGNTLDSIGARTAARGGTVAGLPSSGAGGVPLPSLPSARASGAGAQPIAQINLIMNDKVFATALWSALEPIVDQELALALTTGSVPNAGQRGVGGAG